MRKQRFLIEILAPPRTHKSRKGKKLPLSLVELEAAPPIPKIFLSITWNSINYQGLFNQKNPRKLPRKIQKILKNPRIFFWGFKIRIPYLGVNNFSNSVFKYFFIHIKSSYTQRNPEKNPKISENIQKIRKNLKKFRKNSKNPRIFLRI